MRSYVKWLWGYAGFSSARSAHWAVATMVRWVLQTLPLLAASVPPPHPKVKPVLLTGAKRRSNDSEERRRHPGRCGIHLQLFQSTGGNLYREILMMETLCSKCVQLVSPQASPYNIWHDGNMRKKHSSATLAILLRLWTLKPSMAVRQQFCTWVCGWPIASLMTIPYVLHRLYFITQHWWPGLLCLPCTTSGCSVVFDWLSKTTCPANPTEAVH